MVIDYALIGLAPYSFHYDESKVQMNWRLLQYAIALNDMHNFKMPIEQYKKIFKKEFWSVNLSQENFDVNNIFLMKTSRRMNYSDRINARIGIDTWKMKNYPDTREENIKILDNYLTLCEKNNVCPIMFSTPFTEGYKKYFSTKKLDEFYYLVREALKKHSTAKFFDGWNLPGFSDEYFYNAEHLNTHGAEKFSTIFNEFILNL